MYKMTQVKTTIKEFYKRTPTNLWAQSINRVTNRQKKKKKEIGNFFTALYLFSTVLIGLFTNAEAAHNLRKCLFCFFYNLQVALSRHSMAKKTWNGILKLTPVR